MAGAAGDHSLKIAGLIYVTMQQLDWCRSGNMEGHQTGGAVRSCVLVLALQSPYTSHKARMYWGSVTEHNVRGTGVTHGRSVSATSDLKLSYTSCCSVSLTFMALWFIIYSHIPRTNSLLCLCSSFLVLYLFFHRDARLLLY